MALKPLLLATQPFYSAHHVLRIGATPPESRADIRRLIRLDFCVFFAFGRATPCFICQSAWRLSSEFSAA